MTSFLRPGPVRIVAALAAGCLLPAQEAEQITPADKALTSVATDVRGKMQEAVAELEQLRALIAEQRLPLDRGLREREDELLRLRTQYQERVRTLDSTALSLNTLRDENNRGKAEAEYVEGLLLAYTRSFEAGLHIAEYARYADALRIVRDLDQAAPGDDEAPWSSLFEVLDTGVRRLEGSIGGARFSGRALDGDGIAQQGEFVLVGPVATFVAANRRAAGSVEQRLGSSEPTAVPFPDDEDGAAARAWVESGTGPMPVDATLGNAQIVAATRETLWQHVQKGGPVMVPIIVMAGCALLVAIYKWLALSLLRRPAKARMEALLRAVDKGNREAAAAEVAKIRGPIGAMLADGVAHLSEPRQLVEEVMYESLLRARLQLQRLLPFIAICAAAAPLLGLLGTVTGIINTFKQITVFGSGDVRMLSGGISEALITTKFGLIVAIPSLLLHAYLSRKARRVTDEMESAGMALLNRLPSTTDRPPAGAVDVPATALPASSEIKRQVGEILVEMLGPLHPRGNADKRQPSRVG